MSLLLQKMQETKRQQILKLQVILCKLKANLRLMFQQIMQFYNDNNYNTFLYGKEKQIIAIMQDDSEEMAKLHIELF